MATYGTLEHNVRYLAVPSEDTRPDDVEQGAGGTDIEDFLQKKVESLGSLLRDVEREILGRREVSSIVRARIYEHYLLIKAKLIQLYSWPLSSDRAIEGRRQGLEEALDTLLREHRNEQVKCAQDVSQLKVELWRWLKEYLELSGRVRLLTDDKTS